MSRSAPSARPSASPAPAPAAHRARPARRGALVALLATLVAASVMLVLAPAPAGAQTQDFLSRINQLRASRGLNALAVDANTTQLSEAHTQQMAASSTLVHSSNLSAGVTSNWMKLGENVGTGPNTELVWQAFLNSPSHFENLIDPSFTHVGVGVVIDGQGMMWTTHRFVQIASSGGGQVTPVLPAPPPVTAAPRPAPAAPPPTVRPAPRPTATVAPVVTTTAPPPPPEPVAVEAPVDPASPAGQRVATVLDALHSRS